MSVFESSTPGAFYYIEDPIAQVTVGIFVLGTKVLAGEGIVWAQSPVFAAQAHLLSPIAHDFLSRSLKIACFMLHNLGFSINT